MEEVFKELEGGAVNLIVDVVRFLESGVGVCII